jgi:hypothetical protein
MTDDDEELGKAIDHVLMHGFDIHYEEVDPAFFRRIFEHHKAGLSLDSAWRRSIAEKLVATEGQPRPRWLQEMVAINMVEQFFEQHHGPKVRPSRWVREVLRPAYDQTQITTLTKRFEARGVRNPRVRADERYAQMLGRSVDALRKRRQRARKG